MPTGIYKRTEKTKEKMKISRLEFLKNNNSYWLGKKRAKKTIRKMMDALKKARLAKRRKVICPICKKEFSLSPKTKQKYCSMGCVFTSRKGNKFGWKGGRTQNNGYIYIFKPNHPFAKGKGYVAEHRTKVEEALGYILPRGTFLHHINKRRNDNRISNLMAFKNISSHNKYHSSPTKVNKKDILFNGKNLPLYSTS